MDHAQQTRAPGQALRVLVVDSQHSRKATVSLLESCDYKVGLPRPLANVDLDGRPPSAVCDCSST